MAEALNQRFQYESGKDSHCENKDWFLWHEPSWVISVYRVIYAADARLWRLHPLATYSEDIRMRELAYSFFTGQL